MMQWSPLSARCLAAIIAGPGLVRRRGRESRFPAPRAGSRSTKAAYSAEYEIFCKKETVDEDSFDKLRATKPKNWQQLIDFGQAFLPPNTVVDGSIMSSRKGHYGSVYMVTAIGAVHLSEPKFHLAVEAMTKANPLGVPGTVAWRSKESIGDYSVDFYNQTFPESNVGGGPRECMGFIRYIHGTPPSHAQRVIGTYCEIGKHQLDAARAAVGAEDADRAAGCGRVAKSAGEYPGWSRRA
jgi:hypothetical protein